jgi:hypothetical protein
MGFIKDVKAGVLAKEAARALDGGRRTFTPILNTPSSQTGMSGNIDDWSAMVDEVEAVGWRLEHWAIGQDNRGRPQAYPVFRRV